VRRRSALGGIGRRSLPAPFADVALALRPGEPELDIGSIPLAKGIVLEAIPCLLAVDRAAILLLLPVVRARDEVMITICAFDRFCHWLLYVF